MDGTSTADEFVVIPSAAVDAMAARAAAVTAEVERTMPQPTPEDPFPNPNPNPTVPTYSALDLMGEVYLGLWGAGKIPPGPMRDPVTAQRACTDLLRAFGVTPTDQAAPAVDTQRAAGAVAAVCGVPA